uniref:DMAP1-binding domain-containing protein n=1 Tax=Oryzias melastigma TaxID=30732 RepID=A0A3B3BPL1_ORYME
MADRGVDLSALPKEVRDQLAELDLELSEGDITQKGYEKKRTKLLAPFLFNTPGKNKKNHAPPPASSSRYRERRSRRTHRNGGTRDDRYRSDIHSEAVQAALAQHKEEKMALPMPTKRRSTYVPSPIDTRTPPDSSSASEDESAVRRQSSVVAPSSQVSPNLQSPESWLNRSALGSSTSSSASSTLSHGEAKPLFWSLANILNSAPPPDVTAVAPPVRGPRVDLPSKTVARGMNQGANRSSMMETADGVPVSSRVSTKIQQLLNTLKRPKKPPLSEFFTDDSEEIVEGTRRSVKLAYTLLNKLGAKNEQILKPGDRVGAHSHLLSLVSHDKDTVSFN